MLSLQSASSARNTVCKISSTLNSKAKKSVGLKAEIQQFLPLEGSLRARLRTYSDELHKESLTAPCFLATDSGPNSTVVKTAISSQILISGMNGKRGIEM